MKVSRADVVAAVMVIIAGIFISCPLAAEETAVPDGTEITLRLRQTLSSETAQVNEPILFEVVEDVEIDGRVVIEKGAEAKGAVTRAQHRKGFGRRGKLEFAIDVVEAVDGRNLRLGSRQSLRGKDLYGTAGVVTILTGPFGVFVKGKDVEVPIGTEYIVYTNGQRTVATP